MGTWGTGPFDSDLAADFVDELEGLTCQQVIDVLDRAFQRVTNSGAHVDGGDGAEAVAAGALVGSTLPDSRIVIDPDDGPREPLPELPASLRASARLALDRVTSGLPLPASTDNENSVPWPPAYGATEQPYSPP